jgi:integrase
MIQPVTTMRDLLNLYTDTICKRTASDFTRSTLKTRSRCIAAVPVIRNGVSVAFGDIPVAALSKAHLNQLQTAKANHPVAANNYVRLLKTAWNWGTDLDFVPKTDIDPFRRIRPLPSTKTTKALPPRVVQGIVHAFDVTEATGRAPQERVDFLRLLFGIGIRATELRRLRVQDIDLKARMLIVVQKGNNELELPWPPALEPIFQRRLLLARGCHYLFPGYVHSQKQERSTTRAISRNCYHEHWREVLAVAEDFRAAREASGLTVEQLAAKIRRSAQVVLDWEASPIDPRDRRTGRLIVPHALRAANITTKVRKGASVRQAGASVGHTSERTTNLYMGPLFEQLPGVVNHMNDFFTRDPSQEQRETPSERIGANLRRKRETMGLSQRAFAKILEIDPATLREREKACVRIDHVQDAAAKLGCSLNDLLEGVV